MPKLTPDAVSESPVVAATEPAATHAGAGSVLIRRARVTDMPQVQKIINHFADRDEMLHRSLNELYEHVRDFVVAEVDGQVQACAAIQVTWDDLAELKCVAVAPEAHGRGLGRLVIEQCLAEARDLGLRRVFALTYKPEFFSKFGFEMIDRTMLPHKVWGECIKCHKFPNCNEIAMMHVIGRGGPANI
ncbi:MAG: N-acetyltransferase [Candidatus Sumerlaeaceae bacterium]|nr:N-acetyltransferase [Candidatus Sumerlaeaceae bacterium]